MIQCQLKLRLNSKQEAILNEWLWMPTGVWNRAVRKIEHDAADKIYYSAKDLQNLLANHGEKIGATLCKGCSHKCTGLGKVASKRSERNRAPKAIAIVS